MISVVVYTYNCHAIAIEYFDILSDQLLALAEPFEIVIIDDDGDRQSKAILSKLASLSYVSVYSNGKHLGADLSTLRAMSVVRGDRVLTLDVTRQYVVSAIPAMFKELNRGYDIVFGISSSSDHRRGVATITRRLSALVNALFPKQLPYYVSDCRLFKRQLVKLQHIEQPFSHVTCELLKHAASVANIFVTPTHASRDALWYTQLKLYRYIWQTYR